MKYIKTYENTKQIAKIKDDFTKDDFVFIRDNFTKDDPTINNIIENKLKINNYIIAYYTSQGKNYKIWENYLNNNIGQVIHNNKEEKYCKTYYQLDDDIYNNFFINTDNEPYIKYINNTKVVEVYAEYEIMQFFSPNKEDCQIFLNKNKYNL